MFECSLICVSRQTVMFLSELELQTIQRTAKRLYGQTDAHTDTRFASTLAGGVGKRRDPLYVRCLTVDSD